MSDCERFEHLIEAYLAGDISGEDLATLEEHSGSCRGCRKLMDLHRELMEAPAEVPLPSEEDLSAMRSAVLRRVGFGEKASPGRPPRPFWKPWAALRGLRPAFAAGFAIVLVAVGFGLGRIRSGPQEYDDAILVDEMIRQASLERGLDGYWDSPFIYSNVNVRRRNGDVLLSFDATRHVDVATTLDSPLAREVLVHAMIESSPMGSRFEAMAAADRSMAAGGNMDERLREAMVFILLNDPSLPVRLRSLEVLSRHSSDPVVQDALLTCLAQDPSVQVRLQALETLASRNVAPDVIRNAIGDAPDQTGRAVLHRAIELVGES
jgi:anti-sigma factor RsiW